MVNSKDVSNVKIIKKKTSSKINKDKLLKMRKLKDICSFIAIFVCFQLIRIGGATHLTGTFHPNQFFKFIIKFGFQKTERHSQRDSFGYIYGNITSKDSYPVPITFAVLDKPSFLEYYGNRTIFDKDMACQRMFQNLDKIAHDQHCHAQGLADYFRRVPCPSGQLCPDEDSTLNVVVGNQFTYVISDLTQPRYELF